MNKNLIFISVILLLFGAFNGIVVLSYVAQGYGPLSSNMAGIIGFTSMVLTFGVMEILLILLDIKKILEQRL